MALIDDLGAGPVGIDTSIFIYLIEEDGRFLPIVEPLLAAADAGKVQLVASALTLLEVLVIPYRAGNASLAERYEELLTQSRGVTMVELTRDHMRLAAQIRAATGIATPDALQLAVSLAAGCTAFVTNDRRLPSLRGLKVVQLSAYTPR